MPVIEAQFVIRNSSDLPTVSTLHISPMIVPNAINGQVVVGNTVAMAVGGRNQDPIVPLIAAPYHVRIAGRSFDTQFDLDLTNAPTGSVVNAANYIIT